MSKSSSRALPPVIATLTAEANFLLYSANLSAFFVFAVTFACLLPPYFYSDYSLELSSQPEDSSSPESSSDSES
jgi:hypothetical protein